jgi:hypothetical protein
MDKVWAEALRLIRTVRPGFKAKYAQEAPGLHSCVWPDRRISYGWLVILGLKDRKQTTIHEMAHILIWDLGDQDGIPVNVQRAFPGVVEQDYTAETYKTLRKFLPIRVTGAVTRYGASHPLEDLTEAVRLVLQDLDNFPKKSVQRKKCRAVRRWLGLPTR